jgi:putative oxidoreductase
MTYLQQVNVWSSKHQRNWFVVLRALLGLSLFLKGIQFIKNTEVLERLIAQSTASQNALWLNTFIPWLHLFGGIMIIAGLFTRLSVLIQVPVLIGAVFFTNFKQGFFSGEPDLLFSIVILVLLLFFLVEGGGQFSLDKSLRESKK